MDRDDPILEACLEEVLGGKTPPDLTARILKAASVSASANGSNANGHPLLAAGATHHDSGPQPVVEVSHCNPSGSRRIPRTLQLATLAVGLCALCLLAVIIGRNSFYSSKVRPSETAAVVNVAPLPDPAPPAGNLNAPSEANPPELKAPAPARQRAPETQLATVPPAASPSEKSLASAAPAAPPKPEPSSETEIVAFINTELARIWSEASVKPATPASDADWCKRLYVSLLGRAPRAQDELNPFLADRTCNKRARMVDSLLTDEPYVDEYARKWSIVWKNTLLGLTARGNASPASREHLEQYLRGALSSNKPYDAMVRELLTATGATQAGTRDYNPAVNFLLDVIDKDGTQATSRVARVFLGQQLQCAKCHDHPSKQWSQDDYWALNGFFRQMKEEKKRTVTRLVNVNFYGKGPGASDGKVFYETPAGLMKLAPPRFLDGTRIPDSGDLAVVDRRRELARLVVGCDLMSKALVNRVWAHFFGYGFTRSVDDLGRNPSSPAIPVLDRVAREFVAHDYDLKSLMRWIALSDAFSRSSQLTDLATRDMPEGGEPALFSRFYSRPTQGQDLDGALTQAARLRKTAKSASEVEKARLQSLAQFNIRPADAAKEPAPSKSLILNNSALLRRSLLSQHGSLLSSITGSKLKFDQKVEHLFLAALDREPSTREQNVAARILANSKGSQTVALEDIWWAILNSNEFISDH